jgi:hypothetical protein
MENNSNNFEKNKYNTQINGKQISNLEKEKSNNKLAEKIEKGLNIHSMPNSFREGKFNSSVHPNDVTKSISEKSSSGAHKHKFVGVLIIIFGILILGALAYFLYDYVIGDSQINNNLSDNQVETEKEVENDNIDEEVNEPVDINEEEPILEEDDNLNEDIIDTETATSTDEFATSTEEVITETATSTEEVITVKDTDEDGLTDPEEHLLNTNINLVDSDSDSYDDLSEVLSLYNPAGSNLLKDNPAISEYSNPLYNYNILHPQSWTRKINNGGESIMFMNDNEGFFQISVEVNEESLSVEDWYRQAFNLEEGEVINYFSEEQDKIISEDNLVVYYADQENIYVFSYVVMSQTPSYPNIFKVFVNSFNLY